MKQFGPQILLTLRSGKAFWTISFGCVFFGFAGPFGSFSDLGVGYRLLFWVPVFVTAFVLGAVAHAVVVHLMRVEGTVNQRVMTYLLFSAIFSPLLFGLFMVGPVVWGGANVSFSILSSWVLLTAGTCTAVFAILNPEPVFVLPDSSDENETPVPSRLFRRIGRCSQEVSITRLTVNDHYVLVGLSDGSEQRLLMRLSDAIAEMDEEMGFITHRSHWVSQRHIKGAVQEGRREMLELTTGVRVPVSRTYRPVLVAAGVLPEAKELTVPPSAQRVHASQKGT